MSNPGESQDTKDNVLVSGLAGTSLNGNTSTTESGIAEEETDTGAGDSKTGAARDSVGESSRGSSFGQAESLVSETGQQLSKPKGSDNAVVRTPSTAAPIDYFGHDKSPSFTTTSTLQVSPFSPISTSQQVAASETEGDRKESSASTATVVAQPASTLTSALQNSSSSSNNNNNNNNHNHTTTGSGGRNSETGTHTTTGLTAASTTASAPTAPATETIDPVASYSAWRKKKDTETLQGTQVVMESFLKQHSAYDVLPVSYRQIVLDTTLLVKKALSVLMQYNIVSAPLWDSTKRKFAGMLTATDFINLIQFYYSHSSYTAAIREMDQFQISQLRDVEKVIGVPPPELFSLHPLQSLYDACQLLVESRAHRLPLVDVDSETGEEMIVSVLTQYRILKFIAMNYQDEKTLRQPLSELKIGIYTDLAVANLSSPVMSVIDMFVKRRISSVPIVDEDGVVLNVFETVDVMTLVKAGVYRDLDLCVAEALLRRPEDFAGVHTCTLNDSLSSIFGTIRKSQVHRLIVVDSGNKLKGIVSLSDIMRYLIGGTRESSSDPEGSRSSDEGDEAPASGEA
ncbi:AMP-activated serine/threonine-protein kinase regulatory subunit [Mortierella claussenii]|nr:AMP-activated serine/threonine-protein kinase regulatory subunit [Mortierella claussenii]